MSSETVQMMKCMSRDQFEGQIAMQCAPLLAGVKISNLLTVCAGMKGEVIRLFRNTGIFCHLFYESKEKVTFFLYQKKGLEEHLNHPEVNSLMESFGYCDSTLREVLRDVSHRYTLHMGQQGDFPHEVGLLLGYPAKDVEGFIRNQGKNFRYSGYWKVYGDIRQSQKAFEAYDRAKEEVVRMVFAGMGILEVLRIYNSTAVYNYQLRRI